MAPPKEPSKEMFAQAELEVGQAMANNMDSFLDRHHVRKIRDLQPEDLDAVHGVIGDDDWGGGRAQLNMGFAIAHQAAGLEHGQQHWARSEVQP